ncbi:hypothetical protein RHOFW104T7_07975 [Rhodanobacter thiooxydans]|uniref:Uncharacterized protein n=2 Tax=Rhodanobacter thiooxydans TaxID=416169 RepID=A0A154QLE7_9GAMM|nr:hypothetical protein [Rhodanobacter thiooxydans]KZC24577.1 hypothetical protein RHOFW104T7_07975 [Rhodanobacter thiooxydans]MCW0201740.1 hypothetical protein [Rhodanobacter thiooxydans]
MTAHPQRSVWTWLMSLFAIGFGLLTLREGGAVLFVDGAARHAAGHYVPFVVWFNFLAGFAYVVAGIGLWLRRRWAARLALAIAVVTALVFLAFAMHVALGGAWEHRTPIAMTLRTMVWMGIAILAQRLAAAAAPAAPRTEHPLSSGTPSR